SRTHPIADPASQKLYRKKNSKQNYGRACISGHHPCIGESDFNWLTSKKNIYEKDNSDDAPGGKHLCGVCTE
ncbi:MAG TPA: hypothetical protein VNR87_10685, partial [Flavisolibacter sp.]|nr:hypothetical protein [Flavisolibacter sp.]